MLFHLLHIFEKWSTVLPSRKICSLFLYNLLPQKISVLRWFAITPRFDFIMKTVLTMIHRDVAMLFWRGLVLLLCLSCSSAQEPTVPHLKSSGYLYDEEPSSEITEICQLAKQYHSTRFRVENFTVHIFKDVSIPDSMDDQIQISRGKTEYFEGNPSIVKILRIQTNLPNGSYRCRGRVNVNKLPCPIAYRKGFGGNVCVLEER